MTLAQYARIFVVLAGLGLASLPARGQPTADAAAFSSESARTLKRLAEIEQKLLSGDAGEAADELQHLLDEAGNDLVTVDGVNYQPARSVIHGLLARLPADALGVYRARVDAPARVLLARGLADRDPRPLRTLLARYYASRPAEEALVILGDLLFEQGRFSEAEAVWRQLLPGDGLRFPDPDTDPASVRARIVLSRIYRGGADTDLAKFEADHPTAAGHLAGRDGPFAAILKEILDNPPPPRPTPGDTWATFAGDPDRTGRVAEPLPRYWTRSPTWKTPLSADTDKPAGFLRPMATRTERAAAFHPVVLDGIVYIADSARVTGFDLESGRVRARFDLRDNADAGLLTGMTIDLSDVDDADYTLTVADGRLYARLGRAATRGTIGDPPTPPRDYLVCLAPTDPDRLDLVWKLAPPADGATWEGAPLILDGRVYAAYSRPAGNRVAYVMACYDDPPGDPVWVAPLFDAPVDSADDSPRRHHLLTRAGDRLVFAPDVGLVAAVDMTTGRPAWGFRYERNERLLAAGSPRDLCPPVHVDGRVFVAPADTDCVFALDAVTGKELWTAGPFQVSQLLGVTRGRLIVTLVGRPSGPFTGVGGVRGLDLATGSSDAPDGWAVHDDPFLKSFGRGLMSDELIVWPTSSRDGIFLLNATDGTRRFPWLPGAHGNLAYADGVLVVATPTEVWGYVSPRRGAAGETPANRAERAALDLRPDDARAILRNVIASDAPAMVRTRAAARLVTLNDTMLPDVADPDGWLLNPAGKPVTLGEFADPAETMNVGETLCHSRPVPSRTTRSRSAVRTSTSMPVSITR